jgi:uncharacterized membrane protein
VSVHVVSLVHMEWSLHGVRSRGAWVSYSLWCVALIYVAECFSCNIKKVFEDSKIRDSEARAHQYATGHYVLRTDQDIEHKIPEDD